MSGFVDEAQIHVKAGNGGAGAVAFRREAHVERGGPDGGDGGTGGDVILEASTSIVSLLAFRDHPHRRGEDATHGGGAKRHGRSGQDLVVYVPEGTVVKSLDGAVLGDLVHAGDRFVVATGGRGGRGNARFLTNKLRAPAFAEQGELGEERWLNLELKLLADVALVGFPNAGKSTLISRISAARPKIGAYPFTTLEPHLGVVRTGGHGRDGRGEGATEYVVADIPGLIEGASEGRGLGFQFLRHIERARILLVLVDLAIEATHPATEQLDALLRELGQYRPDLLERPRLVVGSRADAAGEDAPDLEAVGASIRLSAATGEGLEAVTHELARLVTEVRAAVPHHSGAPVVHRPLPEGVTVVREGSVFVVEGKEALRAVAVSDLNDAAALAHVQRRLRRIGVDRALARAGAREGDTVRIGGLTFDYQAG